MIRLCTVALLNALAFGSALGSAFAQTAPAQDRPVLRAETVVTGDLVRIGDLVENAGIIANIAIFRAPDLGTTGTVSADAVVDAVRAHALVGLDTGGISEVIVVRASRSIAAKQLEDSVAAALSRQFNLGEPKNIAVAFERDMRSIQVEPSAKGEPRIARINYDARTTRFDATIEIPTGIAGRGLLRLTGRAVPAVDIVTVTHSIERGTILKDGDIAIERRARAEIGRDIVTDRDLVVGFAARGPLQPGRPIRSAELMKPELVTRNDAVTLVFEVPGVMITARGKAVEGGAEGDIVNVLNEQSKRTIQGVVTGPGRVTVSNRVPRLAANIVATPNDTNER
ncbi:MAG TPA: flagellar basal body P-ring formation chaperone FlgA [Pseudolabrys sp.]